jgi:predicted CxxxxCH...CXXCH cytochrome family protein
VQLSGAGCSSCHGSDANPAPPVATNGDAETTSIRVGAHQAHVTGGTIRTGLGCDTCHVLPSALVHSNGTVDLAWSALAGDVTWDRGAETCSTYCHGATLGAGGTNTLPVWTEVGTGQAACGTCHGSPPPAPHPANPLCNGCHPETVDPDGDIYLLLGRHVDGTVQVAGLTCRSCHGSSANPAPPVATTGESETTSIRVGAHQAHVTDGEIRAALGCDECHLLPTAVVHSNDAVDLPWGPLAGSVTWDRGAATCSTYCHGATLAAGGTNTLPVWTEVGTGQTACGTCHGNPPPAPHPAATACAGCHPDTVAADGTIRVALGRHVNGRLDASGACGACHGAPPASGAHRAHAAFPDPAVPGYGDLRILEDYAPEGGPAYRFGCGHCHPLDPARHMDSVVDVDLSPSAAGASGLRARNAAGATFVAADGSCSGVYCHSSGQATPAFVEAPGWRSGTELGCAACHGNPPAYPSGGPGAPDANGHLGLTDAGREFGHYLGLAGPSHAQKHGGGAHPAAEAAAPITCQTCHFATTDATATGPSGFYWLDTTGGYALPGGDPARADDPAWQATQCGSCHGGAGPAPAGTGRVLPLRHVNGRRDVVFDPRTALPGYATLPPAPDRPTRPYWVTSARFCDALTPAATLEGTTLSLHLGGAQWDPATKSCSGVGCHFGDAPVWGRGYRVGAAAPGPSCCRCHGSKCAP